MRWLAFVAMILVTRVSAQNGASPSALVPGLSRAWVCETSTMQVEGVQVTVEKFCWHDRLFFVGTRDGVKVLELATVLNPPEATDEKGSYWALQTLARYSVGNVVFRYLYIAVPAQNVFTGDEHQTQFLLRHPRCKQERNSIKLECQATWGTIGAVLQGSVLDEKGTGEFMVASIFTGTPDWVKQYAITHPVTNDPTRPLQ